MPKIFVYGTLKRGESNHQQLAAGKFLGGATTQAGFALYRIADFPGMVGEQTSSTVSGEVWEVSNEHLEKLDAFEGVADGLYVRAVVSLGPPHEHEKIETYIYARDVSGKTRLGSLWGSVANE